MDLFFSLVVQLLSVGVLGVIDWVIHVCLVMCVLVVQAFDM